MYYIAIWQNIMVAYLGPKKVPAKSIYAHFSLTTHSPSPNSTILYDICLHTRYSTPSPRTVRTIWMVPKINLLKTKDRQWGCVSSYLVLFRVEYFRVPGCRLTCPRRPRSLLAWLLGDSDKVWTRSGRVGAGREGQKASPPLRSPSNASVASWAGPGPTSSRCPARHKYIHFEHSIYKGTLILKSSFMN